MIGCGIEFRGTITGSEDLIIEGTVDGTVKLPTNTVTVGIHGRVTADIHGNIILVKGNVSGNLYASEKVTVLQSGTVCGNIIAPRVLLEEGAKLKGSIDMDPQTRDESSSVSVASAANGSKDSANGILSQRNNTSRHAPSSAL